VGVTSRPCLRGLPQDNFCGGLLLSWRHVAGHGGIDEATDMVRFYCPRCWHDFAQDLPRCPYCGAEILESWRSKDYVEKLIVALEHPEPSTPIRAAWLLGQSRERRAIEPLKRLAKTTRDLYISQAAIQALSQMDRNDVYDFLQDFASHPTTLLREAARSGLEEFDREERGIENA
jgi:DNA-directed RNA polymerase subunit RPC12/RpoP